MKNQKAFTLLEMLLVIAIIAILAGIVIIAINPGRQLAQARNAQRASDLRALHSAVQQYYIDNKAWPTTTMPSDLTEVCDVDGNPLGCLDLSNLVPNYLPAIPTDPQATVGTNYQIAINPTSNTPELTAPSSTEYGLTPVQLGTTTLVVAGSGLQINPYTLPTDQLVSYWPMEGDADDAVGSNAGTANSGVSFGEQYGVIGQGANFNGNDGYIDLSSSIQFDSNDFSISLWLKTSSILGSGEYQEIFISGYNGTAETLDIAFNQNQELSFYIRTAGYVAYSVKTDPNFLNDGEWHNLTLIRDGATISMYIDGLSIRSGPGTTGDIDDPGTPSRIGNGTYAVSNRFYDGSIDEFMIYNKALSIPEVEEIYNYGYWYLNN